MTVPDTKPSATPKAFATELFNFWGIGKKGKNNGVLLLISSGKRRIPIETGSGIQGILPDAKTVSIIQTDITPKFKQQDFDGGTLAGTKALVNVLQTPIANTQSQNALPLAPIVPGQGVKPSANTQSQNTLPLAPTVPNQAVTWEPISRGLSLDGSSAVGSAVLNFFLKLCIFIGLWMILWAVWFVISRILCALFPGTFPLRRSDYSSGSSGYSSSSDYSSSDSGGSFGGGDSGGGGGGGDW